MQVLIANFTEFQLATLFTFLLHETVFFLSGLPSLLFERFGLFAKYKIQVHLLFNSSSANANLSDLIQFIRRLSVLTPAAMFNLC
jgi:4-alpha-methyl-delta7-sterol-4alpha-methyl oxidase